VRSATEVLREAAARLAQVSDTPRLDAELLMAHALGVDRSALLLGRHDASPAFDALVARRLRHEPVAYITGTRAFWSIDLAVTPDVLIPRPDSETLIEAAVAYFGDRGPATILDLGTGSGALLLAALTQWPLATGLGVDRSAAALTVARGNAERLDLTQRAQFVLGDWGTGIAGRFDLILCNPPYVEEDARLARNVRDYEPHSALFAGEDGLAAYQVLVPQLAGLLAPAGIACLEIGSTQAAAVSALASGFIAEVRRDLGGRDRCVVLRRTDGE